MRPSGTIDDSLMENLRRSASVPNPEYQVVIGGKIYLFTKAERQKLIDRVAKEFRTPMVRLTIAVQGARVSWVLLKEMKDEDSFISWSLEKWSGAKFPSERVIKDAEAAVKASEAALARGDLRTFSHLYPKAEQKSNFARSQVNQYRSKLVNDGQGLVEGLEFISVASFTIASIIAVPVAASFGAGAITAGVIAGSGTNAIETISREVGKGIAGTSKGLGDATKNVLTDAVIGGSVGAFVKGKGAEKLLSKAAPLLAKRLAGDVFKRASNKVVTKFLIAYFQKNGARMLEGIVTEIAKSYKSNSKALTFDKLADILVKEILTAGLFGKLEKLGKKSGTLVYAKLSKKAKQELLREMGDKAKKKDIQKIFSKVFEKSYQGIAGDVYDKALSSMTGNEDPKMIEQKVLENFATNKKLLELVKAEAKR